MNRKLRVLMLSVFAVLFVAASAFALVDEDVEINAGETNTETFTEGINYKAMFTVSLAEFSGEEGETDTRTLGKVVWEVTPVNSADTWLTWHVGSEDNSVIYLEGRIPAVVDDETANNHYFLVAAHVSGDLVSVDAEGNEITTTVGDEEVTVMYSGDIIRYAGDETLEGQETDTPTYILINPEAGDFPLASVDIYPALVSADTSEVSDIHTARKDNYTVTIHFPMTTAITIAEEEDDEGNAVTTVTSGEVFVNAALEYDSSDIETFNENIDLPSWLAYEIVETQYAGAYEENDEGILEFVEDDSTTYVKTLKIFYSSDYEPADKAAASVRITVSPASTAAVTDDRDNGDANESTVPLSEIYGDTAIIGWNLEYAAIPPVRLNQTEATLQVYYGSSADLTVSYDTQATSGDIVFSPSLDGKVALTVTDTPANSTEPGGLIKIVAEPAALADAVYSTDMIVTDTNGLTATMRLYVSVDVPSIVLDKSSVELSARPFGEGASQSIAWSKVTPADFTLPADIPSAFGLKVTSSDETSGDEEANGLIVVSIAPQKISGDYEGTITVNDVYGKSASIAVILHAPVTSEEVTVSGAISGDSTVYAGRSAVVVLSADNSYGAVTWEILNGETLHALGITITKLWADGNEAAFNCDVPWGLSGSYEAEIGATDQFGRSAGTYSFAFTIAEAPIALSGDFNPNPVNVVYSYSADTEIIFVDAMPSNDAFWSMSPDISADVALEVAWTVANSSDNGIDGKFTVTVTPINPASADYTTTLYFYDSNDNVASAELTVKVAALPIVLSGDFSPNPVIVEAGSSATTEILFYDAAPNPGSFWGMSPDISADVSVDVSWTLADTSNDSINGKFTVTVEPINTADAEYTTTLYFYDSYDNAASADLTVRVTNRPVPPVPGAFAVTPSSTAVSVAVGASKDVTLTAANNSGDVRWTVGTVPSGVRVSPATAMGTSAKFTVTGVTASTTPYSVTVTATDAAGRTATSTLSISVTGTTPVPGTIAVTPSVSSLSVRAGNSANVTFTAEGATGTVTWTLGTIPSGITVSPSSSQTGTSVTYTVSGVTAGSYSLTVRASDSAGASGSSTVSITVTSSPVPPDPEELTEETKALIETYKSTGALNEDGTLPDSSMSYTSTNPSAHTLSRTGTNQVTKGSAVNPVDLVLDFPVDIWKVYINGVLAAWSYTPGVTGSEADDFVTFYPADNNGMGVDIVAESGTKATVTFDTNTMASGSNQIAAAFVPDADNPTQEIGRTSIATVEVSSSTTSGDVGVGASSGGCSTGLGALVSALAAAFFISKKRS